MGPRCCLSTSPHARLASAPGTQGWRLGKLGAQSPLNLALQLAQLPSPEIHFLLSCFHAEVTLSPGSPTQSMTDHVGSPQAWSFLPNPGLP